MSLQTIKNSHERRNEKEGWWGGEEERRALGSDCKDQKNWIMFEEDKKAREDWSEAESGKNAQNNIMIKKMFEGV